MNELALECKSTNTGRPQVPNNARWWSRFSFHQSREESGGWDHVGVSVILFLIFLIKIIRNK